MFRCCVPYFCSSPLIGLYLLCTACAPHRARSSFFLNKGKGIGSPRPLSGAEGSTSPHLPRRPMGESFWGERQRRWGDDNAPQGGPGAQPRHAFGDFRRETKVTRGLGRSAQKVGAGTMSLHKSLPGRRAWQSHAHAERPLSGAVGAQPPQGRSAEGRQPPRIGGCRGYSPRNISLISPTDFPSSRSLRSSSIRSTLSSRR